MLPTLEILLKINVLNYEIFLLPSQMYSQKFTYKKAFLGQGTLQYSKASHIECCRFHRFERTETKNNGIYYNLPPQKNIVYGVQSLEIQVLIAVLF